MYKRVFAAALMGAMQVNAQNTAISALTDLFTTGSSLWSDFEFWEYFVLSVQEDPDDIYSTCFETFEEFKTLALDVMTLVADMTDYRAGIAAKGNGMYIGSNYGNDFGYYMYQANKFIDIGIEFTDVWGACSIDYFVLSLGRSVTSVSGALNTGINIFFRLYSNDAEDTAIYTAMSNAVTDNDAAAAGAAFGHWWVAFLMTDIPA